MAALPKNIIDMVQAEKELPFRPKWDDISDPRFFVFTAPLKTDNLIIGGFELRAKVSKKHVDRDALMQLEFTKARRERVELWRCQWRPFETHQNKNWGPPGYKLARFESLSHHHPFLENFIESENRMRGGSLPGAVPIYPDPENLSEFIAFCGKCFRIKNMEFVDLPSMSADMFWVTND